MAKRLYINGNYIVKDDNGAVLTYDANDCLLSERTGDFVISDRSNKVNFTITYTDAVNWLNSENGSIAYTVETIRKFLRVKTGAQSKIDVVLQDSTSPLIIVNSSKIVIETATASITAKDDYIVDVVSATSFLVGQYLTIYSEAANRVYFSRILSINVLAITLDRPIDFEFAVGSFVSVADTNMNVNGSVTPQIFGIRNPTEIDIPLSFDITRIMFKCLAATTVDLSKFGDIASGLTKGITIRRVDGEYRNILNVKTNADFKNLMYDFDIQVVSGNQQDGFTGRLTFAGQNKMGAVIRIGPNEDLQVIIQDDLTSLSKFEMIAEGSEVID